MGLQKKELARNVELRGRGLPLAWAISKHLPKQTNVLKWNEPQFVRYYE